MKNVFIFLFIVTWGLLPLACSDDHEGSVLKLSQTEIALSAAGERHQIQVETDELLWQLSGKSDWVILERDSCFLRVSADNNPTREVRSASFAVVAGKEHVSLQITQQGSVRAVGEYYPDATNPVGVIYSLSDGGNHGKVISFDEITGFCGPTEEANLGARDLFDGKSNTQAMLNAHKDKPDFQSAYSVFWWLLNEKNGGDVNGGWYIPEIGRAHV